MLDTEGELVCATASNVFVVRDGTAGDARSAILRRARRDAQPGAASGGASWVWQCSEEPLWPHDLDDAS